MTTEQTAFLLQGLSERVNMNKADLLSYTFDELKTFIAEIGEKSFRTKQIFEWIHKKNVDSFDEMSNLSKDLRENLKQKAVLNKANIVEKFISKDDGTIKYLFEIENNNIIESVLLKYSYGNTVCISSQAGCRMGCSFCASTIDGLERNLSAGEMLSQIYEISKDIGERISNVVIMGSGEPLDNYDNLLNFLEIINSPDGAEIGHRHITVSTCGLVDKIYELCGEKLQITLAVSLHAPNDEIRRKIMPISKKYPIEALFKAAKDYGDITKRRVSFEYALISGVNDSKENARELASKLKGSLSHVNLIPVNDVKERNYIKSSEDTIKEFAEVLKSANIETTIRRKLGSDINAACGQLRRGYKENNHKPLNEEV